jgi:hypothetical protein
MKKSVRRSVCGVWLVGLLGALEGCSSCAGEAFTIKDGVMRFPVPGASSNVVVLVPDITSSGASAQRARDFYVYEGDREAAHAREVYPGQSVRFAAAGQNWRIEVIDYVEHLLNADEAKLCAVRE